MVICLNAWAEADGRTLHVWCDRSSSLLCFANVQLYGHLRRQCPESQVHDIIMEAVEIEKEFLTDALPCGLIGINAGVRRMGRVGVLANGS